jgi:hypothetical protein
VSPQLPLPLPQLSTTTATTTATKTPTTIATVTATATTTVTATTTALATAITLATALAIALATALATALAIAISGCRSLSSTAATTAAIAVAIATTTNVHIYCSRHWLVVALFSAVRFRHRMPSCDHQPSRFRPLLPPIVIHCCHRCRYRCRQAAATTTTTPVVKLTVVHCQRKRQQQHHHQHTNSSTNVKTFTNPVDLDLFNLSTVFEACDVGQGNSEISKLLALKNFGPFLQSTYYWMSRSTFLGGGAIAQSPSC